MVPASKPTARPGSRRGTFSNFGSVHQPKSGIFCFCRLRAMKTSHSEWLVFIARNLQKQKMPDFGWWTLPKFENVPRLLPGLAVGLLAGTIGFVGYPFPVDFGL